MKKKKYKNGAKKSRVITFAIAKLDKPYLNGEQK